MSREQKEIMEERMEMIWKQPLTMTAESEEKIQDAYEKIRRQCAQKNGKKVHYYGRRSTRRLAVASLAAVMLLGTGIVAAAAMGYFTKQATEESGVLSYEFQINYEMQPVSVQAEPEYLPEGLEMGEPGKYYSKEEEGKSISIIPVTMLNLEQMKSQMNFRFVDQVEHTTILDMEADLLTSRDDQKYQRGKSILLFNPTEGYVVWLWGDYGVSMEELKKVAEGLKIQVLEDPDLSYASEDMEILQDKEAADGGEDFTQILAAGIKADQIITLGEELDCVYSGAKFRIEAMKVFDSIYEVPGYTEEGLYDKAELTPWIHEDGTHKPYLRACFDSQTGEVLQEETVNAKFMAVKIHVNRYGEADEDPEVPLDAQLVSMTKPGTDGAYHWLDTFYDPVPSENYGLQMDDRCFYLSTPGHLEGEERLHSFFYRPMDKGEELTYIIIFAVDEDVLADENTELFLRFNAQATNEFEADYCALR